MAIPSPKSPSVEALLERTSGRTTAIEGNRCVPAPMGCGGEAVEFEDNICLMEYTISGLCQTCQHEVFGADHVRYRAALRRRD